MSDVGNAVAVFMTAAVLVTPVAINFALGRIYDRRPAKRECAQCHHWTRSIVFSFEGQDLCGKCAEKEVPRGSG